MSGARLACTTAAALVRAIRLHTAPASPPPLVFLWQHAVQQSMQMHSFRMACVTDYMHTQAAVCPDCDILSNIKFSGYALTPTHGRANAANIGPTVLRPSACSRTATEAWACFVPRRFSWAAVPCLAFALGSGRGCRCVRLSVTDSAFLCASP